MSMWVMRRAAILLALSLLAVGCARDPQQDRLETRAAPSATSEAIHDGDRVAASGRVVQVPGSRVRLCSPEIITGVGYPPGQEPAPAMCEQGVWLEDADMATLTDRREKAGAVEGWARIVGVLRDGTVSVETQTPPEQAAPEQSSSVPCPEPTGGWPRDPRMSLGPDGTEGDVNMDRERPVLDRYRAEHADDVVDILLLRPFPNSVLLGVLARDERAKQAIEAGLRDTYGTRLCVTVSRFTQEQVAAADAELGAAKPDRRSQGVYQSGRGIGDDMQLQVELEVVMLTDALARDIARQPDGLVRVVPWLVRA
jgi:hypothetical protein